MAYASWSVVFGEQPSAAKWNILGANDAAFNNGTGIPQGAADSAEVVTSQTRSNTAYGDLATVGPAVTVAVGTAGKLLVIITAECTNDTSGEPAKVSFDLSGANTLSANNSRALVCRNTTGAPQFQGTWAKLLEGLNAGNTTVTAKYASSAGGTATFSNRVIAAIPF